MRTVGTYGTARLPAGDCVTAFGLDGACIVDALPWADATEFAIAEENARVLTREEFDLAVGGHILDVEARYLEADGVFMLYEVDADVHRFFV